MSKANKVDSYFSMVEDVPELEGMENLVCQVLGMDIFDEDPTFPYAETKKNPNDAAYYVSLFCVHICFTSKLSAKIDFGGF